MYPEYFIINRDAESLKSSRCRMGGLWSWRKVYFFYQWCNLASASEGSLFALRNDCTSNGFRIELLAELKIKHWGLMGASTSRRIFPRSVSEYQLTISAAVNGWFWSILMSNGPSRRKENPRSGSSTCMELKPMSNRIASGDLTPRCPRVEDMVEKLLRTNLKFGFIIWLAIAAALWSWSIAIIRWPNSMMSWD